MAPDLSLKCHFDLWKSLVPKGARVRSPPVSDIFFDSSISFLTLPYPIMLANPPINEISGSSLYVVELNHYAHA